MLKGTMWAAGLAALIALAGCAQGKTEAFGGGGSGAGTSTGGSVSGGGGSGGSGAGGGSGGSGAGGSGGQGGSPAPECTIAEECAGVDLACRWRTCDVGQCAVGEAASGTQCAYEGGKVCDGAGHCVECYQGSDCVEGVCQNHICASPGCVDFVKNGDETDIDCGGSCAPCGIGAFCNGPSDCVSGICNGTCQPCTTDSACAPDQYCDSTGTCQSTKVTGDACTASGQCQSGFCPALDGVCCENACAGSCEACMLIKTGSPNGSCAPVTANSDPDGECSAQGPDTCDANGTGCNGDVNAPGCKLYPVGTECSPSNCSSGQETEASQCDGLGTCLAGSAVLCAPYVCDGNGDACLTVCGQNSDCVAGYECEAPDCTPLCPPSTVKCNGSCIDPLSDETYCGADNQCQGYITCSGNDVCQNGVCEVSTCQPEQITVDIPFADTSGWGGGCCNETSYRVGQGPGTTISGSFADTLAQDGTVASVQVFVAVRHACNSDSNAFEFVFNGNIVGTWNSADGPHCSCGNPNIAIAQNNAAPGSYVRGGSNTVSVVHNATGTCHEAIATHPSWPADTAFRVIIDKTCP